MTDVDTNTASERMNFRTRPQIKETIQRAARLAGLDDSAFAMGAAYRAAVETIREHERTVLDAADHAAFFEALERPADPTPRLRAAIERHRRTVADR